MTVTTVASYDCRPGERPVILEMLAPARAATIAEPGCEYFLVLAPDDEPDRIVLVEGWRSRDALDRHRRTAHFETVIRGQIAPRVRSRQVAECEEVSRWAQRSPV